MTDAEIKPGGTDPTTSNVYDDDDLIDYDDDELEPNKAEEIKLGSAHDHFNETPDDPTTVNNVSPPKLTDFDKSLSIPETVTAHEDAKFAEPIDDLDEIDYDDEEGNVGGDASMLSAPAKPDEQAMHIQEEGSATYKQDQDEEEIDFGIVEDHNVPGHNIAGETAAQQDLSATTGIQQDSSAVLVEGDVPDDEKHQGDRGNDSTIGETPAPTNGDDATTDSADRAYRPSHKSQADAAETDEITWEETEDQVASGVREGPVDEQTTGNIGAEKEDVQQEAAQPFVAGEQLELGEHVYEEADNADEQEFPAITVQYKGEEFPLFSITSEGFFTSTSVLDENIGGLLAGLREELANEIASDEELMFQIDELGLEYSESDAQDVLGHTTLNQILDIFDLLVKNQNPDSERALYTYLFTKPSTTKRFESLIESAAAGTGLDQVVFHFDSPVPHGTNPEGDHVASSFHALEQNESSSDAHEETMEEQQEYDYIDDLDETTNADADTSKDGNGGQNDEVEANAGEPQAPEDLQISAEENLTADLAQPMAEAEANALAEADFEMAMEPDVDNTAEDGDFDANEDLTSEYKNDALDLANADTSASNTIDNDDTGLGMTAEEAAEALDQFDETKAPDQVDDEIDWRDDPADEDISTISAGANKRSHDADGLVQEDGPDPKRQRS